jgi:hypothetical protein
LYKICADNIFKHYIYMQGRLKPMCSMGCFTGPPKIEGLKKNYIVVVLVNKGCKNNCFATFCKAHTLFF